MQNTPFFSIIVPTYNRADLITETIDSILAQVYPHFEIIIVDDGSKDNTGRVIESRYKTKPQVQYFYKTNEERAAARNFGMQQAKGDYAVFLDSDDLMKPHYLQSLQTVIAQYPDVFMLAAKFNFIDEQGRETPSAIQKMAEGWYDSSFLLKGNILACNYCIRIKDKAYQPFPPQKAVVSMEDWLFALINIGKGKIFIKDDLCLSMREHDNRSMNNNQKVIAARQNATNFLLETLDFTESEKSVMKGWSYYFCGIHQYLDNEKLAALKEVLSAIRSDGFKKEFIILGIKTLIGRNIIARLSRF